MVSRLLYIQQIDSSIVRTAGGGRSIRRSVALPLPSRFAPQYGSSTGARLVYGSTIHCVKRHRRRQYEWWHFATLRGAC